MPLRFKLTPRCTFCSKALVDGHCVNMNVLGLGFPCPGYTSWKREQEQLESVESNQSTVDSTVTVTSTVSSVVSNGSVVDSTVGK